MSRKIPPTTLEALVKDYCSNCTFAGVRFVADDTKHWVERLVWLSLVVLSWYGSALLIFAAWETFVQRPISFGLETTYTTWHTKMPAVAVCEVTNDLNDAIFEVSNMLWTPNHSYDLDVMLGEIAYFRGHAHDLVSKCYNNNNPDSNCPMSNFTYYAKLVRSPCEHILTNCSYNGRAFNCCDYFLPIDTDMGKCFSINSIQSAKSKPYPMIINLSNKSSVLNFDVTKLTMVYTLGEDEVPTITTLQSFILSTKFKHSYQRRLSVKNIENDPNVIQTSPKQRACLFHTENEGGLYPHYSYSACTVKCRKKAQLEKCKCIDHFMLGTGMACLHSFETHLTTLKPSWAQRPGLSCDCLPSCDETEIYVIKDTDIKTKNKGMSSVEVILSHLSTERFKRNVVRSPLDLVVSVGGTTGLFVGASLLSFVELVFYFTVRYATNLWIVRDLINNARSRHQARFIEPNAIIPNHYGTIAHR